MSNISKEQKVFITEFLKCFDIDKAAGAAGMDAERVSKSLRENRRGLADKLDQAIERKRLSASFLDPEQLRNSMYDIAMDKETRADSRVRAAALWLNSHENKKTDTDAADKFDKLLKVVGKKEDKSND